MKKQKFKKGYLQKTKYTKHLLSKKEQKNIKGGNTQVTLVADFIVEDEGDM